MPFGLIQSTGSQFRDWFFSCVPLPRWNVGCLCPYIPLASGTSIPSAKESTCQCRRHQLNPWVKIPGSIPGERNGTHSRDLAWRIPWTEEPGGLQFMVSQRVGPTEWLSLCLPSVHCLFQTITPALSCKKNFSFTKVHAFWSALPSVFKSLSYAHLVVVLCHSMKTLMLNSQPSLPHVPSPSMDDPLRLWLPHFQWPFLHFCHKFLSPHPKSYHHLKLFTK